MNDGKTNQTEYVQPVCIRCGRKNILWSMRKKKFTCRLCSATFTREELEAKKPA